METNPRLKILFKHATLLPPPGTDTKNAGLVLQTFVCVGLLSLGYVHVDRLKGYYEGMSLCILLCQ